VNTVEAVMALQDGLAAFEAILESEGIPQRGKVGAAALRDHLASLRGSVGRGEVERSTLYAFLDRVRTLARIGLETPTPEAPVEALHAIQTAFNAFDVETAVNEGWRAIQAEARAEPAPNPWTPEQAARDLTREARDEEIE
jgi:hypothetical protein